MSVQSPSWRSCSKSATSCNAPIPATKFSAQLSDQKSLDRLRTCLNFLPTPEKGSKIPQETTRRGAVSLVRLFAVEALGKHKDKDAYDTILKMVADDPSVRRCCSRRGCDG